MRLFFVTPVWGVNQLGLFLESGLRSLFAPGNLPSLAEPGTCGYLIYTRAEDEDRLRNHPVIRRLEALMPVEIRLIGEPIVNAHRVMSDCHIDALRRADEREAATVFVPPDCVWGNSSIAQVQRIANSGKSLIH